MHKQTRCAPLPCRRIDPFEPNRVWFTTRVTGTHTGTLKFGGSEYKATGKTVLVRCPPPLFPPPLERARLRPCTLPRAVSSWSPWPCIHAGKSCAVCSLA